MYNFVNFKYPILAIVSNHFIAETISTFMFIVVTMVIANYVFQLYKSELVRFIIFCLAGFAAWGASGACDALLHCMAGGLLWGAVWYVLSRYVYAKNIELLFITIITIHLLRFVPSAWYGSYPGVETDLCISAVVMLVSSIWVSQRLQKP